MRWLLLIHRWLGIGIGWLLLAWCLSGIVMMYVAYPEMSPGQRLQGLEPLELGRCCRPELPAQLEPDTAVEGFRVEMLRGTPVLSIASGRGSAMIDLERGGPVTAIGGDGAALIAQSFAEHSGLGGMPRYLGMLERDQWTVYGGFAVHRPLHHFALDDPAGTELYVSSSTGEVVQQTSRRQRSWNWLGAVPHWLYPTVLRQDAALWVQVVTWTSLIGFFLTALGVYIGIVQYRRRQGGRWSPYRGLALWHHGLGLAFGVLTLTWLASGFLSVNPWGALESEGFGIEARRLAQPPMAWSDVRRSLERLSDGTLPEGTVRLEATPFGGRPYYLAYEASGRTWRLDPATLLPAPLGEPELAGAAARLQPGTPIASVTQLSSGDAYYFDHHAKRTFPVYRIVLDDAQQTRYYLDAISGRILQKTDANARWHRWLFAGLHRLDFTAGLRQRPLWDVVMLVLMAGVTAVCFTGAYMGMRHLLTRGAARQSRAGPASHTGSPRRPAKYLSGGETP